MNAVNGSIALATAHKLRSAAAALLADSETQSDPRLADSLMYEAGEISKRADSIEEQVKPTPAQHLADQVHRITCDAIDAALNDPTRASNAARDARKAVLALMEASPLGAANPNMENPEVLRIGVGAEEAEQISGEAYNRGAADVIRQAIEGLRAKRAEAISAERQDAYRIAMQIVEALG